MILPTSLLGRNALTIVMTAGDLWPLGMLFVECPGHSSDGFINWHFVALNHNPASEKRFKTFSKVLRCSSFVVPVMSTLSNRTTTRGIPWSNPSIILWNIPGADATPYGRRLYLYRPLFVLIVRISLSPRLLAFVHMHGLGRAL